MRRHCQIIIVAVFVLFVVSCAPRYMIVQDAVPEPSEGKAIVNFVRPSSFGKGVKAPIWDGEKLIAMSLGKMAFQYECDAGKHIFIAWSEYKSPVEADLLPDRVYYIVLRTRMGWWRGRIHQVPVKKDDPLWEQALTWQKTLPNYTFDPSALAKIEAKSKDKILEYLDYYDREVKGTKHVKYLRPEDGVPVN